MKVAALVSGGVDSSVALALLKEQGHDVTAFYLKIWLEDELSFLGDCPWEEDLAYVRKVCEQLNVPLKIINLQKEYWDRVVSYTIEEVKQGRTPNPDMMCNARVKFDAFLNHIDDSYDRIATGHYASIEEQNGVWQLKRVRDPVKDQTYFLAHLTQEQLSRALFPMGNMLKSEVRELARKFNLPTKDRKDSQGICFLGKINYKDFIKHYFGERKGPFINVETGETIGEHNGSWFYTAGQRKGIMLNHGPWYVVSKNHDKNIVHVSNKYDEQPRNRFFVTNIHWIIKPTSENLQVKVRHGPNIYDCYIKQLDEGLEVTIDGQDQGIAPGQFAVFYKGDTCCGCGTVTEKVQDLLMLS